MIYSICMNMGTVSDECEDYFYEMILHLRYHYVLQASSFLKLAYTFCIYCPIIHEHSSARPAGGLQPFMWTQLKGAQATCRLSISMNVLEGVDTLVVPDASGGNLQWPLMTLKPNCVATSQLWPSTTTTSTFQHTPNCPGIQLAE